MIDAHVHLFHGNSGEYSIGLVDKFVESALSKGITELCLLEHTHQFIEFERMYRPVGEFSEYQRNWLSRKMKASLENYTAFIDSARDHEFPIIVRFGLEACYIPETADILLEQLKLYNWDFVTGSVHYIKNWGFDHRAEFWQGIDVNAAYRSYYEIMLEMIGTGAFSGVGHPDSIKCFGHYPDYDLGETYETLAGALNNAGMYAEQSGGLALNYGASELGMNPEMLRVFKKRRVRILTASDAHEPGHAGMNIPELQRILDEG
ncbi:MAG TPA: PHP domain-containing protein [Clostridia bacterium]|nr:PHP domain-containing protein [Clostridia bacterium]